MTLSESRNSSSWQGAIELGPHLMRLAEELPASEAMGLSFQLRQAMVDVPATAAADQLQGGKENQLLPGLKLLAVLDFIEKVYPALDTADVRTEAEKLVEHIVSVSTGNEPTAALPAKIEPATPAPAPADVPIVAPAPAPHAEATTVPVTAQPAPEETHVHPDSVQ